MDCVNLKFSRISHTIYYFFFLFSVIQRSYWVSIQKKKKKKKNVNTSFFIIYVNGESVNGAKGQTVLCVCWWTVGICERNNTKHGIQIAIHQTIIFRNMEETEMEFSFRFFLFIFSVGLWRCCSGWCRAMFPFIDFHGKRELFRFFFYWKQIHH